MVWKNYIWDFDGTLFDTYPVMLKALKTTMQTHSVKFDGDVARFIKQYSIKKLAQDYANQAFLDDYHDLEHRLQHEPPVYQGIPQILRQVRAKGGQNFVLSHRDHTTFDYLGDLREEFTEIITSESDFPRKPDPAALIYLINKYDLSKKETVMVGDRPLDVEAGKNAGIATLLLDEDNYFGAIADRKIRKWSEWS